jgi:hypothetical protein
MVFVQWATRRTCREVDKATLGDEFGALGAFSGSWPSQDKQNTRASAEHWGLNRTLLLGCIPFAQSPGSDAGCESSSRDCLSSAVVLLTASRGVHHNQPADNANNNLNHVLSKQWKLGRRSLESAGFGFSTRNAMPHRLTGKGLHPLPEPLPTPVDERLQALWLA